MLPLAWAGVLLSSTPLAAWADEAVAPVEAAAESVQQAAAAVTEAAAEAAPTPTWLSYVGEQQLQCFHNHRTHKALTMPSLHQAQQAGNTSCVVTIPLNLSLGQQSAGTQHTVLFAQPPE